MPTPSPRLEAKSSRGDSKRSGTHLFGRGDACILSSMEKGGEGIGRTDPAVAGSDGIQLPAPVGIPTGMLNCFASPMIARQRRAQSRQFVRDTTNSYVYYVASILQISAKYIPSNM